MLNNVDLVMNVMDMSSMELYFNMVGDPFQINIEFLGHWEMELICFLKLVGYGNLSKLKL